MSKTNKPEISVILPSIRPKLLPAFYDSLCKSTTRQFELIVVGPYPLPQELEQYKNIKYARDFGNPTRAQNIALLLSEGRIVTWQADDAIMLPGAVDKHVDLLDEMGNGLKNVVIAKYQEGQIGSAAREKMHPDSYFTVDTTPAASPYLPANLWLFNVAFMHREFLEALGGFDAAYEGTWVSQTDLAIRAQAAGATVKMSGLPCMVCDHMPGSTGDHQPIEECQTFYDQPRIQKMYGNPTWQQTIKLDAQIMNWKLAQTIWTRRFK